MTDHSFHELLAQVEEHTRITLGFTEQMAAAKLSMFRVAGDQLVEHWGVFDQLTMLAQFGALPDTGRAEA